MNTTVVSTQQYLTFRLGRDEFGIEILKVREILEYREPTHVPRTSQFISGVINLRGNVIPVVDLARMLQHRMIQPTRKTCILIIEVAHTDHTVTAGILVDTVNEVITIRPEDIDPPPSFGATIPTDFIRGMGRRDDDRVIVLLDTSTVLSFKEIKEATRDLVNDKEEEAN